MNSPLETSEQREIVLAAITRGYQVMAVEKEMMEEMCGNLRQEQQEIAELLDLTRSDIEALAQVSSDSQLVTELQEQVNSIFEIHEKSQPLLEKAAELCGKGSDGREHSQEEFNQLFQDLMMLKEGQK